MVLCLQRFDDINAQIEAEYGDDIFHELVRESMLNWKGMNRAQQGAVIVQKERRKLACQILISFLSLGEFDMDEYFLAIMILGRILRPLSDKEILAESEDPTLKMWVVVIMIIRLAAKYERSSRDYSSVYGMYLGLPPQVTRRRRCAFKQMVNDAEREVLGILDYDLHWPTPMPFAHRLLGSGTEETTLAHTVEIILIIASVNDCFEQFPVHAIAAASYNLGCKLLGMVQQVFA